MNWQTFIPGVPKPQGSKTQGVGRNGKPFMREDNKGTKPWRKRMVEELQDAGGQPLAVFDSAVWVRLRFVFLRPKSHAPDSLPTSNLLGDVDKLTRNVLDALTQAEVITDDKFVVKLREVEKVYGPNPGVHIEIGSAVPNPFGEGIAAPLRFAVGRDALAGWEPSPEALMAHRLEEYDNQRFWEAATGGAEPDIPGSEGI
jgi:Holliday junction resolvase RusA-like endonuclease